MSLALSLAGQQLSGVASVDAALARELAGYRYDPAGYIRRWLGWSPWAGTPDAPGQQEVLDAYVHALRQQADRAAYESGADPATLTAWWPGKPIRNRLRIEAGHTVGKTKIASGIVNHFFDTFTPAIVYTFAPTWEQIHDLLWKEIKADRGGSGLPGRILDIELDRGPNHFAKGRATNNAHGTGTERIQGQHGPHLLFVLDEAEGIPEFVWDAIDSMASGGLVVVLMLANPRTRASRFHKAAISPSVCSFRISCLNHPNVREGRELIPGAVRREYVEEMIAGHCEAVASHNEDDYTFEVPWRPGVIYKPDAEFLFRVLGIAPTNVTDNTLIPVGRYLAALARPAVQSHAPQRARMGVDVARFGTDLGTLYVVHDGRAWRAAQFAKLDTIAYAQRIKAEAMVLADAGVTDLAIRVDGGGGYGGGIIDRLKADTELVARFVHFQVLEVHFGSAPRDEKAYADLGTELYATAGEALAALRLERVPDELEADLCERRYDWVQHKGIAVKKLHPKEKARPLLRRSPDDGDGFALAAAPDHVFRPAAPAALLAHGTTRGWQPAR